MFYPPSVRLRYYLLNYLLNYFMQIKFYPSVRRCRIFPVDKTLAGLAYPRPWKSSFDHIFIYIYHRSLYSYMYVIYTQNIFAWNRIDREILQVELTNWKAIWLR